MSIIGQQPSAAPPLRGWTGATNLLRAEAEAYGIAPFRILDTKNTVFFFPGHYSAFFAQLRIDANREWKGIGVLVASSAFTLFTVTYAELEAQIIPCSRILSLDVHFEPSDRPKGLAGMAPKNYIVTLAVEGVGEFRYTATGRKAQFLRNVVLELQAAMAGQR